MKNNNSGKPKNKILRLANSGLQLGILIAVGAFGGDYLDIVSENSSPVFTIIGSLLGVGVGLYILYKTVIKLTNDN